MKIRMFIDFTHCDPCSPEYRAVHPNALNDKRDHAESFFYRFRWITTDRDRSKAVEDAVIRAKGAEVFDDPAVRDYTEEYIKTVDFGKLVIYVFGELNDPDHIDKFNALVDDAKLLKAKIIAKEQA